MRRLCRILFAVNLLLVAAASADEKPNFTGTWKQVGSPERVYINRIEHQGPSLKVETTMTETPGPSSLQRPIGSLFARNAYRTDGTEQASTGKGRERWTIVGWEGSRLVFLTVDKKDCHLTVTRETWTLSDDGKTLRKTTRVIGPDGATERKSDLERQAN